MKHRWIFLTLFLFPSLAYAQTIGMDAYNTVRRCVMENDVNYCHTILTPDSQDIFNRFVSYKLMPCLPTDFTYTSEEDSPEQSTVKITMPAGGGKMYVARLVFANTREGLKLDIPASLKRGLGDDWQNKIQLTEQVYLMMKQNMGDKLTCDMLNSLVEPK